MACCVAFLVMFPGCSWFGSGTPVTGTSTVQIYMLAPQDVSEFMVEVSGPGYMPEPFRKDLGRMPQHDADGLQAYGVSVAMTTGSTYDLRAVKRMQIDNAGFYYFPIPGTNLPVVYDGSPVIKID